MIELGKYNELRVLNKTDLGFILSDGEKEILLPYHQNMGNIAVGDHLSLFVYLGKDDNLCATLRKPFACVHDFAFLTVVDENAEGVFMDLGIEKDVFVPTTQQKIRMKKGDSYVVYLYLDALNNRMIASSRLSHFIEENTQDLEEGDEVSLLITEQTDLGFNAIVNNKYIGLLYHNELFADLQPGEQRKGWIKKIRVEGKIDLSLQPQGYSHILDMKDVIFDELKNSNGKIFLGDKSTPEEIYKRFQISKSAFKKTIGALYKERLITIADHQITLLVDNEAE